MAFVVLRSAGRRDRSSRSHGERCVSAVPLGMLRDRSAERHDVAAGNEDGSVDDRNPLLGMFATDLNRMLIVPGLVVLALLASHRRVRHGSSPRGAFQGLRRSLRDLGSLGRPREDLPSATARVPLAVA